jgi:D-alanyl-D-alanine carboxypeptidase
MSERHDDHLPLGQKETQQGDEELERDELEPSEEELRAAETLAAATDGLLADGFFDSTRSVSPPSVKDELIDIAMLRANLTPQRLDDDRREEIIDAAIVETHKKRFSGVRLALVGLAASVLVAISVSVVGVSFDRTSQSTPAPVASHAQPRKAAKAAALRRHMTSRPSNNLLGRPIRKKGAARERIDRVFASRMAGYRALRMQRWRKP